MIQDGKTVKTGISVYLLDDHEVVRRGFRTLLYREPGIRLIGDTENPDKALNDIKELNPDVVILDISLHGSSMDGFCIAQQIKEESPSKPIIMLTAHESELFLVEAMKVGASGFLTKDRAHDLLFLTIKLVHQGICVWDRDLHARAIRFLAKRPFVDVINPDLNEYYGKALSTRELEVLKMLEKGYCNKDISRELNLSAATAKKTVYLCLKKLGAENRTQAALIARQKRFLV